MLLSADCADNSLGELNLNCVPSCSVMLYIESVDDILSDFNLNCLSSCNVML